MTASSVPSPWLAWPHRRGLGGPGCDLRQLRLVIDTMIGVIFIAVIVIVVVNRYSYSYSYISKSQMRFHLCLRQRKRAFCSQHGTHDLDFSKPMGRSSRQHPTQNNTPNSTSPSISVHDWGFPWPWGKIHKNGCFISRKIPIK